MESIHDFGTIFGMFLYTIDKLTFYVTSFDIKLTFHSLEMKVAFFEISCVRMSCWMILFCFCSLKNTLTNPQLRASIIVLKLVLYSNFYIKINITILHIIFRQTRHAQNIFLCQQQTLLLM